MVSAPPGFERPSPREAQAQQRVLPGRARRRRGRSPGLGHFANFVPPGVAPRRSRFRGPGRAAAPLIVPPPADVPEPAALTGVPGPQTRAPLGAPGPSPGTSAAGS